MSAFEAYEDFVASYQRAVRDGNLDALADLFAEDAQFFHPGQSVLMGKQAIREDYANSIGDGFDVSIVLDDVQDCGEAVYATGTLSWDGGSGKWIQVSRRQPDGSLKIHRLVWT